MQSWHWYPDPSLLTNWYKSLGLLTSEGRVFSVYKISSVSIDSMLIGFVFLVMNVAPKSLVTMFTSVLKRPGKVSVLTVIPTIISSSECLMAD